MEKVEFEFPDADEVNPRAGGKVVAAEDDSIEIVDDTPEEDRGRTPMARPPGAGWPGPECLAGS